MKLREKTVSRVAAVAVAAVMAVSAAAPAAFAAAPVANGDTAVVQEAATKTITVDFVDYSNGGKIVGHGTCEITVGQDQADSSTVTGMPAGYEAADATFAVGYDATSYILPVKKTTPATKTIKVDFVDYSTNKTVGHGTCVITEGQLYAKTADVTGMPAGYEAADKEFAVGYEAETYTVAVNKAARKVTVEYRDADNWEKVVGREEIEVAGDADYVGIDVLKKIPANWTVTADTTQIAVGNKMATTTVAVTKVATTKVVKINFYSEDEEKQIEESELTVAADATYVNSSALTAPEGYELCQVGDFAIRDGYVYVPVRAVATTKVVKINFYSEAEEKQIEESELTVAADATYVNSSALTAPEGYELCQVGDFAIRDGYVYVAVRKVATTKVVKINFYSEDENKQIAEPELTVAADATYVNSSALTAPEGYELCEVGDFAIRDGYVYVPVRKVATTKVVKINFYSEDEEKQIAEPELTVAADATYVNSSALTAPEGYELCEVGDFAIRDGYVYVPVKKVTTPDPVDPTPTPDPEPTPAAPISPVATTIGLGAWLLVLGGLILGFLGL